LRDVVEFYIRGGIANPHQSSRIRPLGLSPSDVDALVALLRALDGEGHQDETPRYFPRETAVTGRIHLPIFPSSV
jgi:cytochrome c peroxidase